MKRHNVHTYTMQCDVWVGDTSAHNTPDASLYIKKSKSTTNNGSKSFTHTHTRDLTPCALLLLLHPAPEDFMHHYTEGCALVYSLHISNDNNEKKKGRKNENEMQQQFGERTAVQRIGFPSHPAQRRANDNHEATRRRHRRSNIQTNRRQKTLFSRCDTD